MVGKVKALAMDVFKIIPHTLITVFCGDLLYLYYGNVWTDGISIIRHSEVLMLFVFGVLGIVFSIRQISKMFKDEKLSGVTNQ